MKKFYLKNKNLFLIVISVVFFSFMLSSYSLKTTMATNNSNKHHGINLKTRDDSYVDYSGLELMGGSYQRGSSVHVNFTVLLKSNASVEFSFNCGNLSCSIWSPEPPNFVLAVGESFAENFTLRNTISQSLTSLTCNVRTTVNATNATIRWSFDLVCSGNDFPVGPYLIAIGAIALLIIGDLIRSRKQGKWQGLNNLIGIMV